MKGGFSVEISEGSKIERPFRFSDMPTSTNGLEATGEIGSIELLISRARRVVSTGNKKHMK